MVLLVQIPVGQWLGGFPSWLQGVHQSGWGVAGTRFVD